MMKVLDENGLRTLVNNIKSGSGSGSSGRYIPLEFSDTMKVILWCSYFVTDPEQSAFGGALASSGKVGAYEDTSLSALLDTWTGTVILNGRLSYCMYFEEESGGMRWKPELVGFPDVPSPYVGGNARVPIFELPEGWEWVTGADINGRNTSEMNQSTYQMLPAYYWSKSRDGGGLLDNNNLRMSYLYYNDSGPIIVLVKNQKLYSEQYSWHSTYTFWDYKLPVKKAEA